MGLGQIEPKQVEHPDNNVKLARHAQIQQEQPKAIVDQVTRVRDFIQVDAPILVKNSVQNQVHNAAKDPAHSHLVDAISILVVVIEAERLIVHYGKQREAHVWQHEEIRQTPCEGNWR